MAWGGPRPGEAKDGPSKTVAKAYHFLHPGASPFSARLRPSPKTTTNISLAGLTDSLAERYYSLVRVTSTMLSKNAAAKRSPPHQ